MTADASDAKKYSTIKNRKIINLKFNLKSIFCNSIILLKLPSGLSPNGVNSVVESVLSSFLATI